MFFSLNLLLFFFFTKNEKNTANPPFLNEIKYFEVVIYGQLAC